MNISRRLLLLTIFLVSVLGVKAYVSAAPRVPPRQPLANFPTQIGDYTMQGSSRKISDTVQGVLRADDYVLREYLRPDQTVTDLFIAYYEVQKAGESMHSPKNCLPGSGWDPVINDTVMLEKDPTGKPVYINRYLIEKEGSQALVLYWYQSNGRVIASEYWGKFYLVAEALRSGRRDGAIIRLVVPVQKGEDRELVTRRTLEFARAIRPELPKFLPN
jgi:EpsI family protein